MQRLRRLVAVAMLAGPCVAARAAAPDPADAVVRTDEPRAYGHAVGDVIERLVDLDVPAGRRIADDAWPRPGRVDAWFELRDSARLERSAGWTLRLRYQLINAPRKVATLALPPLRLALLDAQGAPTKETLDVPEWPVSASPLTAEVVLSRAGLDVMQPDIAPAPEPVVPIAWRLALWSALAALALAALALRRWPRLAFWRRDAPFRDALADLARLAREARRAPADAHARGAACRRLHAAFDRSAGCALFAQKLDALYTRRPQFAPLAGEIEAFYAASRRAFFAAPVTAGDAGPLAAAPGAPDSMAPSTAPGAAAPATPAVDDLVALCRRLARLEAQA